jgi:hypothetical protein
MFAAIVCVFSVLLTVSILSPARPFAPPVSWVTKFDDPITGCAGDKILFPVVLMVKESGSLVLHDTIAQAYDHPATIAKRNSSYGKTIMAETGAPIIGSTVVGQLAGERDIGVVILRDDRGVMLDIVTIMDNDEFFVLPDLPPGPYIRNMAVSLQGINAKPALRQQSFTILDNCVR